MKVEIHSEANFKTNAGIFLLSGFGVLVILLMFQSVPAFSSSPSIKSQSQKELQNAYLDSVKIERLFRLSHFYCDYMGDLKTADSLADNAIRLAGKSSRPDLSLYAYFHYLEEPDLVEKHYLKALNYGVKALTQVKLLNNLDLEWRVYKDLAELYLTGEQYNSALKYSNKAIVIAGTLGKNSLRGDSYLLFARSLEGKKQKTKAHGYFLNAVELAEKIKDPLLMIDCYDQLSGFYNRNKMFEQAIKFKRKEGELTKRVFRTDTVRQMWKLWELLTYLRVSGATLDERTLQDLLTFSIIRKANKLKLYTLALYRAYYLDSEKTDLLYNLYNKQYPQELKDLASKDPAIYYKLMAYFKEKEKVPDSAIYYFKMAEPFLQKNPSKYMQSQFYYRLGQFLSRQNKNEEAVENFYHAYKIAEEVPYFDNMLNSSRQLEALYRSVGNYQQAYRYSVITRNLGDSINDMSRKEQMIMNSINREQQVRDRITEGQKRESERMIRNKKTERNMLAGFVAFLFILSFVIFRSYRVQKKSNIRLDQEKKRSDNLLLNILPGETAEELKHTGKAKAKYFPEVTVMFTDFKDFTQASEKMKADELVEEIHFYFSEFDRIVSRFGVEKIKTIGDSYMCVGGLPVSNDTHAKDVVSCALELQEFMEIQKIFRSQEGKPWFELRIGIHTGPVVAGIVGTRKFAYDIWGDTVNTASRMETCGETGMVNISGATYEKVRDYFSCTYRGKVQAKHKGLVDMYFANSRI
jgi:class 3 adenylate cyclase